MFPALNRFVQFNLRIVLPWFSMLMGTLAMSSCESADLPRDQTIIDVRALTAESIRIETEGMTPVGYRSVDCGGGEAFILEDPIVEVTSDGNAQPEEMNIDDVEFSGEAVVASFSDASQTAFRDGVLYSIRLTFPGGNVDEFEFRYTHQIGDTASDPSDDSSSNTDSDTDTDTDSGTSTDSGPNATCAFHVEAECAFGASSGNCSGEIAGTHNAVWSSDLGDNAPWCDTDCLVVEYMNSTTWIAFHDIDFSGCQRITAKIAGNNPVGNLQFALDVLDPSNAVTLAAAVPTYTESWTEYKEVTFSFAPVNGTHTLYVVGGMNPDRGGNANIDWIEISSESASETRNNTDN